jgi:hypothetical protein
MSGSLATLGRRYDRWFRGLRHGEQMGFLLATNAVVMALGTATWAPWTWAAAGFVVELAAAGFMVLAARAPRRAAWVLAVVVTVGWIVSVATVWR